MMINELVWRQLKSQLDAKGVTLVAVSKTKPVADILALYALGQRDFGENYVQELVDKHAQLPNDIRWHFIGHLQSNKVKQIAPFVQMIHAVDSFKLLIEINKHAVRNGRTLDVLLQMHIAEEETKFGMDVTEIFNFMDYYRAQKNELKQVNIRGLMGMSSLTDDVKKVEQEFLQLHNRFLVMQRTDFMGIDTFNICSMGMSTDYPIALHCGSTMVRIGSAIFGSR
ncbi:MAG: YggS family pyridoxal phosphate-dependent enzyme [Bacteroidetes bacterium]|nr:YggS family pyridoxal phosphate-dependent enzyme [Bacteroidota bacterium]